MKPDHLSKNFQKIPKTNNKKNQFNFEIKPILFLGLNIQNVLIMSSQQNSNQHTASSKFLNSHESNYKLNIVLIIFFFIITVFILWDFINNSFFFNSTNLPLLNLILEPTFIIKNVSFNFVNQTFNDILINLLQEFKIV